MDVEVQVDVKFVKHRPLHMDSSEKLKVFNALLNMASDSSSHQMEMLRLSTHMVDLLQSDQFCNLDTQRMLADLFLIGLNKNGQYVSAVAPSYKQPSSKSRK